MAVVLDRYAVDGDVYDVLEDCDQLSLGLGRLRRLGRISEQDWCGSIEHLDEIRATIEAYFTAGCVTPQPERQQGCTRLERATGQPGELEGHQEP